SVKQRQDVSYPFGAFHGRSINSAIPMPINTPHKRIAAPQPFVKSAADLWLTIFTGSAGAIVNTSEVLNSSLPRSTLPTKQYPFRGIVSTYVGFSGESPRANRNLFTVVFTLAS